MRRKHWIPEVSILVSVVFLVSSFLCVAHKLSSDQSVVWHMWSQL